MAMAEHDGGDNISDDSRALRAVFASDDHDTQSTQYSGSFMASKWMNKPFHSLLPRLALSCQCLLDPLLMRMWNHPRWHWSTARNVDTTSRRKRLRAAQGQYVEGSVPQMQNNRKWVPQFFVNRSTLKKCCVAIFDILCFVVFMRLKLSILDNLALFSLRNINLKIPTNNQIMLW